MLSIWLKISETTFRFWYTEFNTSADNISKIFFFNFETFFFFYYSQKIGLDILSKVSL